jgi:hypothetical protein
VVGNRRFAQGRHRNSVRHIDEEPKKKGPDDIGALVLRPLGGVSYLDQW